MAAPPLVRSRPTSKATSNCRRDEPRTGRQRRDDAVAELARQFAVRRQLLVAFDVGRLRTSGGAAILPAVAVHQEAEIRHLVFAQYLGNTDQHGGQNLAEMTSEALRPGASRTNGAALW